MENVFQNAGLIERKIERGSRDGRDTYTMISWSVYETGIDDLWDAVTNKDRLPRWFATVEGDLKLGGRYSIKDNASGSITHCKPPEAFALTWEFAGDTSWVTVSLSAVGPEQTRLQLTHEAGAGGEHFEIYGPGAAGVGWDLGLVGLGHFLNTGETVSENALLPTPAAKDFIHTSATAWGKATAAAGYEEGWAMAAAQKTAAFFAGE